MKPDQVRPWPQHQCRQPLHKRHRCERGGAFAVDAQALVGDRRARDVTG
jgi:hypothetical protein